MPPWIRSAPEPLVMRSPPISVSPRSLPTTASGKREPMTVSNAVGGARVRIRLPGLTACGPVCVRSRFTGPSKAWKSRALFVVAVSFRTLAPRAAHADVAAVAGDQGGRPGPADKGVVTALALQHVRGRVALDPVGPGRADDVLEEAGERQRQARRHLLLLLRPGGRAERGVG